MIITRTPFRVSFFGGGTDYPAWYMKEGGAVLSTTINKYCYITCRRFPPFFPNRFRIVWSHIEPVSSISEILHPAVRNALKMMDFSDAEGLEIHHQGDLPARSGMGSSSSFANGIILALYALRNKSLDKHELFKLAMELEQKWIADDVGSQDQVATAVGGQNVIHFRADGDIEVEPVALTDERRNLLNDHLMLFYSGTSRTASEIAGSFVNNLSDRNQQLKRMHEMVFEARDILEGDDDLNNFGEMLDETWRMKRQLGSKISNATIDELYAKAKNAGAIGGKLLGAGGAGFLLFYVPLENQAAVRQALNRLIHVPFDLESEGAVILQNSGDVLEASAAPL